MLGSNNEVADQGLSDEPKRDSRVSAASRTTFASSDQASTAQAHTESASSALLALGPHQREDQSGAKTMALPTAGARSEGSAKNTGPSIGSVTTLGHRGCHLNMQGWFLSVGNPEQYDFTVSPDGETLVVEPNQPDLTGNFEFVHCAEAEPLVGKRVRFSARVKTQNVMKTAQLRLLSMDARYQQNSYAETKVGGTHDWQDFSVDATVPPDTAIYSYGLSFRSPGKLWISHPTFAVMPSGLQSRSQF